MISRIYNSCKNKMFLFSEYITKRKVKTEWRCRISEVLSVTSEKDLAYFVCVSATNQITGFSEDFEIARKAFGNYVYSVFVYNFIAIKFPLNYELRLYFNSFIVKCCYWKRLRNIFLIFLYFWIWAPQLSQSRNRSLCSQRQQNLLSLI